MPVHTGKDNKGCYAQWGGRTKYYYECDNATARSGAKSKAAKQGAAAYAGGYKGNVMLLQRMMANFTGAVRYDEMEGKRFIVAPMIMMVEGVHEGSNGPLYYPKEELAKIPQVWNYKPVIVYHPQANGQSISACDPIILSNRRVGVIMNTKFEDNKLKAEAWLEEDRMNKVDERIARAIEKNQMMELSTGLYTDNESMEGEWNGEKYEAIARNYRPDHLALLPDLKGACSIEDGAGFLRLNAKAEKISIIGNAMSHGNVRSLLNSWLQDKNEDAWVEDVYDDFFIFMQDGKLFKGTYSIVDNSIEVVNTFEEVVRVTEYRTKDGAFVGNKNNVNKGEIIMKKEKIVDALIESNSNSWGKDDRETLMAMDDNVLAKMESSEKLAAEKAVENVTKKAVEDEKIKTNAEAEVKAKTEKDGEAEENPKTLEQYVTDAPPELQPVLRSQMASYNAIKASLIALITANKKNQFTEEQLNAKDVEELRKLRSLISDDSKQDDADLELNFAGQGDVADVTENKEEPMLMPSIVGAKSDEK